jgi:hypothetical protein
MSLSTRRTPALALLCASTLLACDGGGSEPPVPTTISLSPATVSFTAVGQTQQLTPTITDQRGDPVDPAGVEWESSDAAVASVSPTGLVTSEGTGTAEVTAAIGGISAVAEIGVTQSLANFKSVSGDAQGAPAGQALPQPLVVEATDALGSPIAGVAVEFTVTLGGGSVQPAAAPTGADGRAATVFTLGPAAGPAHQVRASVSGTAFTVSFGATAGGQPAVLEVFAGNGQSALAGAAVLQPPAVRVLDEASQAVPGVEVQFTVASGGGAVSGAVAITNAIGVAAVGNWTLGTGGVNTLTATVPGETLAGDPALFVATVRPAAGFDIQVRHQGAPSSAQLLAFAQAEVRWEGLITGDLPDVPVNAAAGTCGGGSPALSETVDDLLILANLSPIDGPGAVLGSAGPCFIRVPGFLPIVGQMRFDTDDLEFLEELDLLDDVILHEMGHVLGFGTVWDLKGLLAEASLEGGVDPHFTGPLAIAAFDAAGGAGYTGQKVPVENTGGLGTADSHWREEDEDGPLFGSELMTGFIGIAANPLSAITVQSLADLGYAANPAGADPFALGPTLRAGALTRGFQLRNDVARGPIYGVDPSGTVVGVVQR